MVNQIEPLVADWQFDAVSLGFPSPVRNGKIVSEPKHLGRGWVGFNFEKALRKPVRIINDAAMQALGSYHGRRMLFLGLGTGLGSAHTATKMAGSLKQVKKAKIVTKQNARPANAFFL